MNEKSERFKRRITAEELTIIKEEYSKGTKIDDIAKKMGRSKPCINENIRNLRNAGEIKPRLPRRDPNTKPQKERICDRNRNSARRPQAPDNMAQNIKPVKCTLERSLTCIYGCTRATKEMGLCNYILITRQRRGCDPDNCTKYIKTSKNMPRLFSEYQNI